MPDNLAIKPPKRKRTVQIERLTGTKPCGKADGLHFIPGNSTPVRWHPSRSRDFAAYRRHKVSAISEPGRSTEEEMIRALRFERQSKDAALFREAMAAESVTWRRPR